MVTDKQIEQVMEETGFDRVQAYYHIKYAPRRSASRPRFFFNG